MPIRFIINVAVLLYPVNKINEFVRQVYFKTRIGDQIKPYAYFGVPMA